MGRRPRRKRSPAGGAADEVKNVLAGPGCAIASGKVWTTGSWRPSLGALAAAAFFVTGSHAFAVQIPIQATLSGAGEVPPNDSPAKGLMTGTFDTDTKTLDWTVTYSGLTTPPIGAHFHGPVSYLGLTPEENAPIQVGTPGSLASPFHSVAQIDDTQAKDLKDGRWYFNLHSKKFPSGEIRGPVVRR